VTTGHPYQGVRGAQFKTNSSNNRFKTFTAIADIPGPTGATVNLDAGFRYRKQDTSDTGVVVGYFYTRPVEYEHTNTSFEYTGRLDQYDLTDRTNNNNPNDPGNYVWTQRETFKDDSPSTAWRDANFDNYPVGYKANSITSLDVMVEFTTTLHDTSNNTKYVYVDNARVRTS
jgi:hypothetical protein